MAWELTDSLDEFDRVAAAHLLADPARQTVPLSVLASLREAGLARFGDSPPLFGWHRGGDGAVDGAVLQTPPFPLLLASAPAGSVASLLTVVPAVPARRAEPARPRPGRSAAAGRRGGHRPADRLARGVPARGGRRRAGRR